MGRWSISRLGLTSIVVAWACNQGSFATSAPETGTSSAALGGPAVVREYADDVLSPIDPLPPGERTSAAHSDEWKIRNALAAAPDAIAERATVKDWPNPDALETHAHERVLREGDNGWTCMPDRPGKPQHDPLCADETMMKWLHAAATGQRPNIDRVGVAYMLLGEAGADVSDWSATSPPADGDSFRVGPHIMVALPDDAADALRGYGRDPNEGEPFVRAAAGGSPLLVIPIARAGEQVQSYVPPESRRAD